MNALFTATLTNEISEYRTFDARYQVVETLEFGTIVLFHGNPDGSIADLGNDTITANDVMEVVNELGANYVMSCFSKFVSVQNSGLPYLYAELENVLQLEYNEERTGVIFYEDRNWQ